jgi:6-phosphogluconolactonase
MSNFELITFGSPDELANAAASQWLAYVQAAGGGTAPICVALAGGRITRRFFEAAAATAKNRGIGLERVHFFWGDERCVPPDDPESNFRIARELLFEPLRIPAGRIHRIRGEAPPESAAAEATAELLRIAPVSDSRQPVIDLVLLGLGENGHVASLFPEETEAVAASLAIYRAVTATKPPPQRITLGYAALAAARDVWVLASGTGKEDALRDSIASDGRTPLARLLRLRPRTRVFTDIILAGSPSR